MILTVPVLCQCCTDAVPMLYMEKLCGILLNIQFNIVSLKYLTIC